MKKLVVVFTATGLQGYPIVQYLTRHASDRYKVRALTRDASKPTSKELAAMGAEVVEMSLDEDASVKNAVSGANIIFANTDFWSVLSVDAEVAQASRILKAANELDTLEHFVQSSFPNAKAISNGRFEGILHYNAKNEINEVSKRDYPDLWAKTTSLWVGYYFENWIKFNLPFGPQKISDGTFELAVPFPSSTVVPCTSPGDVGAVFFAILSGGPKCHNKIVALRTTERPEGEKLRTWANILGIQAIFREVSAEEYAARMAKAMPPAITKNVTEQLLLIGSLDKYPVKEEVIEGKDIIDPKYTTKTWEEYIKEADWSTVL